MNLIYTIEHTGTHSLLKAIGKMDYFHCDDDIDLSQYDKIFSTYRNPYQVAASWVNRRSRPLNDDDFKRWCIQWENWANTNTIIYPTELLEHKENAYPDKMKIHAALKKDMDYYHQYIPEKFINFAQVICG